MVKGTKGCFGWALVITIAALVVAAAVTTLVYHQHKKSSNGGSPSSSSPSYHTPPSTYLGSVSYSQALGVALRFFDVQKSGKLPSNNDIEWRGDSALNDGSDAGLDLSGGMYDAGDNMKFSFPMAFTCTLLSWSVLEYSTQLDSANLLDTTKSNIKWISDYLLKTHVSSNELYFQVGDPSKDHACWQRPEDMDEPRPSFKLNETHRGSDVSAEVAAAMAASSLVFKKDQSSYSAKLLKHAEELFQFADTSRAVYTHMFPVEITFYNSTGYGDELLWAASWLFYATGKEDYLTYVTGSVGERYAEWGKAPAWFSWDNKLPGVQVLLSRIQILQAQESASKTNGLAQYRTTADALMCAFIPNSPTATDKRTDAGMIWVIEWNPMQHAVGSALLALIYSDYLFTAKESGLDCSGKKFTSEDLRSFAISQANYLLGKNPLGMSYLVGYNSSYPQYVHHRAASIPSDGQKYGCKDGFQWLSASAQNPHLATGALVGGPFQNDSFVDSRNNSMQNEPTTYNSAALVGLLAGLTSATQVSLSDWN